jgi:protein AFG1
MSKGASIHAAYKSLITRGRLTNSPTQASLVDRLAALQATLTESESPTNGLYIHGSVGTGKSRLADLFASTLAPQISSRRIHFYEFMMDVHARLHQARSRSTYSGDPLVQIGREVRQESRVLCFDEFQVTDIADAMILKRLFGAIWDAGGVMVATSNRHPIKLYEKGLNRSLFVPFIHELERRCEVWELGGEHDYRMTTEGGMLVFFTEKERFWEELAKATGSAQLEEMTIPVMMSRALQVEGVMLGKKAIVHATFASLCEANLGSPDYHALCNKAHTVYLSNIPHFRADELDFVRRFITLIDLAYESKTRIVCLSDVPLFEVFSNILSTPEVKAVQRTIEEMNVRRDGGSSSSMMSTFIGEMEWSATGLRGASLATGGAGESDVRFAVARAVSRLVEMGSKRYGSID